MPDDQPRDKPHADDTPESPEEMMQSLLKDASEADDLPPPEDFAPRLGPTISNASPARKTNHQRCPSHTSQQ